MPVYSTSEAGEENMKSLLDRHEVQYTATLYDARNRTWTVFSTNESELEKLISLNDTQVDGNKIKVWKPMPQSKGEIQW